MWRPCRIKSAICGESVRVPFSMFVHVGLRDSGHPGQAPLGQFAALHTLMHIGDKPDLQLLEVHLVNTPGTLPRARQLHGRGLVRSPE